MRAGRGAGRGRRRAPALVGAAALAVLAGGAARVAAVGARHGGGAARSAVVTNGEDRRSPDEVLSDGAKQLAAEREPSFHVSGQVPGQGGFELDYVGDDVTGSYTTAGGLRLDVQLRGRRLCLHGARDVLTTYLDPRTVAQGDVATWFCARTDDPGLLGSQADQLLGGLYRSSVRDGLLRGYVLAPRLGRDVVDGTPGVVVTATDAEYQLVVALVGPPRPLLLRTLGSRPATSRFGAYGTARLAPSPPGTEVVEVAFGDGG